MTGPDGPCWARACFFCPCLLTQRHRVGAPGSPPRYNNTPRCLPPASNCWAPTPAPMRWSSRFTTRSCPPIWSVMERKTTTGSAFSRPSTGGTDGVQDGSRRALCEAPPKRCTSNKCWTKPPRRLPHWWSGMPPTAPPPLPKRNSSNLTPCSNRWISASRQVIWAASMPNSPFCPCHSSWLRLPRPKPRYRKPKSGFASCCPHGRPREAAFLMISGPPSQT